MTADHEYLGRADEDADLSMLAIVARDRFVLAAEFSKWWKTHHEFLEPVGAGLRRWEAVRFGAPLYDSAHGVLWFVVRRAESAPVTEPPRRVATTGQDDVAERFQKAFVGMVDSKSMKQQ